ncbi:beta-lactamase family protein [Hypoxylon sp. FL1284]|nr:beta-lactamase family protein [Hypoxylon sp. FL1284]
MTSLDDLLESAVADGTAPGIVVIAKDKDGKVDIAKAFSSKNGTQYNLDTVMEISSMSKLPTSIAALQLVEKGLVTLDEDVSHLIPAFAQQGILESVAADGTPTTRPRRNPITLRTLITHSSGAGYGFLDARLGQVRGSQFELPLLFEPGEGWAYGTGVDRAGHVVEALTGRDLEDYMREHIWAPLGADSSTFFPDTRPDVAARRVPMAFREARDPDGPAQERPGAPTVTTGLTRPFGGHGLFASMRDYFSILHSLLVDDGRLLRPETAALAFRPQLPTPESRERLREFMDTPTMRLLFPSPPDVERDYGLGGLVIVGDEHEYWRPGALMWGGGASLNWFIDREAGVCGVFGAQVQPSDARMRKLIDAFQENVYRKAGKLA